MKTFSGKFDNENWFQTWINGETFSPSRSLKIRNHSPDGFAWSYYGSGPAQLALAILLEETDEETAQDLYQDFKSKVIANLDKKEWSFDSSLVQRFLADPAKFVLATV
jgi:hypothetical protein